MGISFVYKPVIDGIWGTACGRPCDDKGRILGHLPGLTDDEEEQEEDEPLLPSQSSVQGDESVKILSWYAYKCNKKPESHGQHDRCKYRWNQKGRKEARIIREIQKTFRAVDISQLQALS